MVLLLGLAVSICNATFRAASAVRTVGGWEASEIYSDSKVDTVLLTAAGKEKGKAKSSNSTYDAAAAGCFSALLCCLILFVLWFASLCWSTQVHVEFVPPQLSLEKKRNAFAFLFPLTYSRVPSAMILLIYAS